MRRYLLMDVVVILALIMLALPPRLHLAASYNEPIQSEEELYNRYAVPWAQGEGATPRDKEFPWHPLASVTHRPPGYVVFVGAVYRAAGVENFAAVRRVQSYLDTAAIVLLYVLGALMFGGVTGRVVGATAAVGMAYYDFAMLFVARILSETLFSFLMIGGLVLAMAALRYKLPWVTFLAAYVLGWATITRPFLIFLLPAYVIWIAMAPDYPHLTWLARKRGHIVAAVLGIVLSVGPVTLRNWQFHGEFIPISTNGGYTLFHSLAGSGVLSAPQELGTKEEVEALELGEIEQAAEYQRRAVAYMIDHPEDVWEVTKRKLVVLLAAKEGHKISHVLMNTPDDAWFYPLVLALAAASLVIRPFAHWHAKSLIWAAIASQVAVSLIANAEVRYRIPIVWLLALLAAWAVWGIVDSVVGRFRHPV
jgi:hypothetical protein